MKCQTILLIVLLCIYLSPFAQGQEAATSATQVLLDSSEYHFKSKEKALHFAHLALATANDIHDKTGKVQSYYKLGEIFDWHGLDDSSRYYHNLIVGPHSAPTFKKLRGLAHRNLSQMNYRKDNVDAAIVEMEKSLALFLELMDSSYVMDAYYFLGHYYNYAGDHGRSIEYNLKSLEIADALGSNQMRAQLYQAIGIIYNKQKDLTIAESYFTKAMDHFILIKDTIGIISVFNDFGILNKNRGNYKAAEQAYLKMLTFDNNPNPNWTKGIAYNNLGVICFLQNKFENGITYCEQGIPIHKELNEVRNLSSAYNYLAKNQLGLGQAKKALGNAQLALKTSQATSSLEKERDALETLSQIHEAQSQTDLALDYFKAHKVLNDSIYNSEKTIQIHGLEKKYSTAKKDQEIAILASKADLNQVKQTRLWMGLGGTALLAILLLQLQSTRQRKQKEIDAEKLKVSELNNLALSQELDFKNQALTSKVLQLCRKNEFLQSLDNQVKELKVALSAQDKNQVDRLSRRISRDMDSDEDWSQFLQSFESVHPTFNKLVYEKYPNFTPSEVRMSCLLKMNLGSKEIANLLNITVDGVKKTRYRMRKKMGIDSNINMTEYLMHMS